MEQLRQIGKYEVTELLGSDFDGLGTLYKAIDPSTGHRVVINLLTTRWAKEREIRELFLCRARTTEVLQHPHILATHALGELDGAPFIVVEYFESHRLSTIIGGLHHGSRSMPLGQRVDIVIQILEALDYAHKKGIVHGTIAPWNIRVSESGVAKLLGFGELSEQLVRMGAVNRLKYLSPEQLIKDGKNDARSDIFSTGLVLYELLTLRFPFEADTPIEIILNVVNGNPPDLQSVLPNAPVELNHVVQKALAKDPAARYANTEDFTFALLRVKPLLG